MRRLADISIAAEEVTIGEIKKTITDIKDEVISKLQGKVHEIPLDLNDFHTEVLQANLYYTDKLYLFTAIEYDGEVYYEATELDHMDELREMIEFEAIDPDKVTFEVSMHVSRNSI